MAKQRSRRLRKKLYTGEFVVLGFEFSCTLAMENEAEIDALVESFTDFIEARNLLLGGGVNTTSFGGFIVAAGRYDSPTEDDRAAVQQWLSQQAKCSDVVVSELADINQSE